MAVTTADVIRKVEEAQLDLARHLRLLEEGNTDFVGALADAQSTLREAERMANELADRIDFDQENPV